MRPIQRESFQTSASRISIEPPIMGWNARDPLARMKKTDAIIMDNLYPLLTSVMVRKGFSQWATTPLSEGETVKHNIRSLMPYQPVTGVGKLFAGNGEGIYNVTSVGAKTAEPVTSTNGEWQSVNMTTPGGNFLWACNGVDDCIMYDDENWTELNATSTPALTGITSSDVSNVSIWKNRLILVKKYSLSFYYMPLNSIAGAASEFPLGSLFNQGGYLVATANWTLDAGEGADDYFVAITSQGEIAVYKGTDPSMTDTFALVGIYAIGRPLGKRCFLRIGGDVFVSTVGGLLPLSKALIAASINKSIAASDRIVEAWNAYGIQYEGLFGWQPILFTEANMLLVNVPIKYDSELKKIHSYQFVMNTITGAWARFSGQNADCWCAFNGNLYFASENVVNKAWEALQDGDAPINVSCQMAYNKYTRGPQHKINLIRFVFTSDSSFGVQIGVDADYKDTLIYGNTSSVALTSDKWDIGLWDTAKWVGEVLLNDWKTVFHKPGNTLSIRLKFSIKNANIRWSAIDLIVEQLTSLF